MEIAVQQVPRIAAKRRISAFLALASRTLMRASASAICRCAALSQCPGALFKPLTDDLIHIETAIFVRKDQMRVSATDFIAVALAGITALELNPLEKR
ncbi:MAG: hypothetical protein ACLQMO_17070 [Acidobacteriaceae bacterium]